MLMKEEEHETEKYVIFHETMVSLDLDYRAWDHDCFDGMGPKTLGTDCPGYRGSTGSFRKSNASIVG
jgi:hypothetical protein